MRRGAFGALGWAIISAMASQAFLFVPPEYAAAVVRGISAALSLIALAWLIVGFRRGLFQ